MKKLFTKLYCRIGVFYFWIDSENGKYYVELRNRTYQHEHECNDVEQFRRYYADTLKYSNRIVH